MSNITEVNILDKGVLEVTCPSCNDVFKALPSANGEKYFCSKCNVIIVIKLMAELIGGNKK